MITSSLDAAPGASRVADGTLSPFFRVAMFAAPVLLLTSTIAFLALGAGINDGLVGGVVTVWSVVAFAIAFVGCARLLESSMPRSSRFLIFGAAALTAGGAGFGIDAIYSEVLLAEHGIHATTALEAYPFAWLAMLPWGWFMPITCILAGALLWRAGLLPWWHGLMLILGGVLFVTGRPARIGVVAIATDVVLIAAFWLLALRAARSSTPESRPAS